MRRKRSLFVLISILFLTLRISGMYINSSYELLSWSFDGKYVLLEVKSHGPEGGGSLCYKIIGFKSIKSFYLSNTMSPGDGSTPENINFMKYTEAIQALENELVKNKFNDIKTGINFTDRYRSLKIIQKQQIFKFERKGNYHEFDNIRLSVSNMKLNIYSGDQFIKSFQDGISVQSELNVFTDKNKKIVLLCGVQNETIISLIGLMIFDDKILNPVFDDLSDQL